MIKKNRRSIPSLQCSSLSLQLAEPLVANKTGIYV